MPYKNKQEQKDFMKRYRTPYMKQYRKFQAEKDKRLKEALDRGDLNMARQIMSKKPNIFMQSWQDNKRLEASQNLCCCCGLFVATEPNGLCKDCAENCAGYLLKDKPCETIELESH